MIQKTAYWPIISLLFLFNTSLHAAGVGLLTSLSDDCPINIAPVCGIDGLTYLNSCFAEAAGAVFYTAGPCYSPGISPEAMDTSVVCPTLYSPVCGFNYTTYTNACEADKAGLLLYQAGQCSPNNFECYDPNLIVASNATRVDAITGVITVNCPADGEAVLGCDGITYPNACWAEASGIRVYTPVGVQECVDSEQINEEANCEGTVEYVCACNDKTYVNACYAEAAGITSYTLGPCGGTSIICNEALPISCGDFLANETTVDAGNQLVGYPGCTSAQMLGPDKVYVFQKTTAGDIQIGLEITTPDLDLDVFLLRGDCNALVCVAASTTPNTITNNEGIVLRDAPLGTYYIVVDQQNSGPGGNYHLELSCGYLTCSEVIPLTCEEPYLGTNANGKDEVSLYTCGNVLNVENNGPEILHSFTITEADTITIDLTNLSANLELFLLSSCNRSACMAYSQNAGTTNEQIVLPLAAGTYYIVVDGYNGGVSDYSLTVNCGGSRTCELNYQPAVVINANCGQNNGEYRFSVSGGASNYIASYEGPISSSQVSQTGDFHLTNLVPGNYTATIQDARGCTISRTFVIGSDGSLEVNAQPLAAGCATLGSLQMSISGSSPPYTVYLSGQASATLPANTNNFTINNLNPGTYNITVVGADQCSGSTTATIEQSNGNLQFVTTPIAASCGQRGRIGVVVQNGVLNYRVSLIGPVSGGATVEGHSFFINQLLPGSYWLEITDALGCSSNQSVIVPSTEMEVQVSTNPSSCGITGSAQVSIYSGTPPYTVNYSGPTNGSLTSSNNIVTIPNLLSGSYTFQVQDSGACNETTSAFVADQGSSLSMALTQTTANCGDQYATVYVNVEGGTPSYSLYYTGPVNGSTSLNATGQTEIQLPAGNYTFTVNDFAGCSAVRSITVSPIQNNLRLELLATANSCGQASNLRGIISSGSPPYQVRVSNQCDQNINNFQTNDSEFILENLANCTYFISITDANGCTTNRSVNIEINDEVNLFSLLPVGGSCGGLGYIDINVHAGLVPYALTWSGPSNGFANLLSTFHRVTDLPAGEYTFTIVTADGCRQELGTTLNNGGNLELSSEITRLACGQDDQIVNIIQGGTAPYAVEFTRLCDGQVSNFNTAANSFDITNLIPCDYRIQVTDASGCTTTNTRSVSPYELFDASPSPGICGQAGSIRIDINNEASSPPYTIVFSGPINGSLPLNTFGSTTLPNLLAGTYSITLTDNGGCEETEEVIVQASLGDLSLLTAVRTDDCGVDNQLWNDITGGLPPYTIEVIRLCDNTTDTSFTTSTSQFELNELAPCDYKVIVTDANGCSQEETTQINPAPANIFTAVPINGPCGQAGRINVNFIEGSAPYQLSYTGPQAGETTVNGTSFSLTDLPEGDYSLFAVDANGCSQNLEVAIVSTDGVLSLQSALVLNNCGQENQIRNDINGGTAPYRVRVVRLCDNTSYASFIEESQFFQLYDLPACEYQISITDVNGCMDVGTVTVLPSSAELFTASSTNGVCNEPSRITIQIVGGLPPYALEIRGEQNIDSTLTNTSDYTFSGLADGTYSIILRDANNCSQIAQQTITNTTSSNFDISTATIFNDCGQYNRLWNSVSGGLGPFSVEVTRLCDNTIDTVFSTANRVFELLNLPPCTYKIDVTDALGCTDSSTNSIYSTNANLVDIEQNTGCENAGLNFTFIDGTGPYRITLIGPEGELNYPNINEPSFFVSSPPNGDYTLFVSSGEGCTEFDFFSFQAEIGTMPFAAFQATQTTPTSYSFSNTSSSSDGTYHWDFGNGESSTIANPSVDFAAPGGYRVCLTVSNNCGEIDSCQNINIASNRVVLDIGEASGELGQIVDVPVSLRGTGNLFSLAGSVGFAPAFSAQIIGIRPALIAPLFNATDASFSYGSENSNGIALDSSETTLLFYLQLEILIDSGQIDLFFLNEPLELELSGFVFDENPSLLSISGDNGTVIVQEASQRANMVILAEDMNEAPIRDVAFKVAATGAIEEPSTYQSDEEGKAYVNQMLLGGQYTVSAEKEDVAANGLSSYGLFVGQRYLLGMETPQIHSPYQLIAADVNCSNSFSTLDLLLMQQIIIGDKEDFEDCPSWVFVHESSEMPTDWNASNVFDFEESTNITLQSDTTTRFVGVKRGDILGLANTGNLSAPNTGRNLANLPLIATLPAIGSSEMVSVDIRSRDLAGLASLQFQLLFDDSLLEYTGVAESDLGTTALLSDRLADRALLRMSWFSESGQGLNTQNESVLRLQFRTKAPIDDWEGVLAIDDSQGFRSEAYRNNTEALRPVLEIKTSRKEANALAFEVQQNLPNPFSGKTRIRFQLPEASLLWLQITDALGRQVFEQKQYSEAGTGQLDLDLSHLAPGLYYYKLQAKENVALLPMLLVR